MRAGVLLYGPPASGKSTITQVLADLDPAYRLFQRVKVGVGNRAEYRMRTAAELTQLRQTGQVIWENHRYGSSYVIDRAGIEHALKVGFPVVHLGQREAVTAVTNAVHAQWLVVDLRCSRAASHRRLIGRGSTDITDRLAVWDQTPALESADLVIDSDTTAAPLAAQLITQQLHAHPARSA